MLKTATKLDSGRHLVTLGVSERNLERIQYYHDPLVADLADIDLPRAIFVIYLAGDEQSQQQVQEYVDHRKHGSPAMICAIGVGAEELAALRKTSYIEFTPPEETMPDVEKAAIYYAQTDAELEAGIRELVGPNTDVRDTRS